MSNPFGVAATAAGWERAMGELTGVVGSGPVDQARIKRLLDRIERDVLIAEATGRWRYPRVEAPSVRREPTRLVPGDVLMLRALTAGSAVVHATEMDFDATGHAVGADPRVELINDVVPPAELLYDAEAYWLPPGAEVAVLESERPPPGSVTLPHGSATVWFAQPIEVPAVPLVPSGLVDEFLSADRAVPLLISSLAILRRLEDRLDVDDVVAYVEGVVLPADPDGVPLDVVVWLLRIDSREPGGDSTRQLVIAHRSFADWRAPLDLLTAIVAWGDWRAPSDRLDLGAVPTRDELRRLRYGRSRRAEEAGAVVGVRVLDPRRRPSSRPRRPAAGTHASPVTHMRAGHWQRYRHGPQDDWHYETHWLPPVLVNPTGRSEMLRVYRLPNPNRDVGDARSAGPRPIPGPD
jgi:hypothetical protein